MLLKACVVLFFQFYSHVICEIKESPTKNKLIDVKPVGLNVAKKFFPLTELPNIVPTRSPPLVDGRRHLSPDCEAKPLYKVQYDGAQVNIHGEDYEERQAKTVATVIFPLHIDHKHFQVTTPIPYLTVGEIEAIGYHPTTKKSEHPSECEKIYRDHLDELYSDESEYSEESLEMARMPLFAGVVGPTIEELRQQMYSDLE